MDKNWKVVFSLVIALVVVFGFLSFPHVDELVQTCTGSFFCGAHIKQTLDYLAQSDATAMSFGSYLYNKIITGAIVFLIILVFSTIAHRIYLQIANKLEEPPIKEGENEDQFPKA